MDHAPQSEKIAIFDTTLRDGQQSPGAGMSYDLNMLYADRARLLGVDVLEAGFPSASRHDFIIVNDIAKEMANHPQSPVVCALTQCREEFVQETINALIPAQSAQRARVHIYMPVDPELMQASLGSSAGNHSMLVRRVAKAVTTAVEAGMEVEFSPEGYSRQGSNFDFTTDLILAAVGAGATIINCPDTIGAGSPFQGDDYFVQHMIRHARIVEQAYPDKEIVWSTHNHNDLGLATFNSLKAVVDGPARQIECTMNGVGERAGNASLEQIVVNITRTLQGRFHTDINLGGLTGLSNLVAEHMLPRQQHGPVVHPNSFRHSSGGHTNAILSHPDAYHAFPPELVGAEVSFCFGPLSGGNHAQDIILRAGYVCADEERAPIREFLKNYYEDRRKGITDEELVHAYVLYREPIKVEVLGYNRIGNAVGLQLRGSFFGEISDLHQFSAEGEDSPLAVLAQAIKGHIADFEILDYESGSNTRGAHAESSSTVSISIAGQRFSGHASDKDIEISALKALIKAVNEGHVETLYRSNVDIASDI